MKNLCSYCGQQSGTCAPFPKKTLPGDWKMAICPKCFSLDNIQLTTHPRENENEFKETLIAQHKNEMRRKMVSNDLVEIIFWFDDNGTIAGFQYTFNYDQDEVSFTWNQNTASRFHRVGTVRRQFSTNTLSPGGDFPKAKARELFLSGASNLSEPYKSTVLAAIDAHKDA